MLDLYIEKDIMKSILKQDKHVNIFNTNEIWVLIRKCCFCFLFVHVV